MIAAQIANFLRVLIPGRRGQILAASIGLVAAAAVPVYGLLTPQPVEGSTLGLPFKGNRLVMIAKGLDPHGGGCTGQKVSLSNPASYGFETNGLTVTKRTALRFEATFDSDKTSGSWSAIGLASPTEITAAFALEGGGQGTVKLQKQLNQPFALGWQEARDCVGKVELACPVVLGPEELKASLRDDADVSAHLSKDCVLLSMPQEKVVQK